MSDFASPNLGELNKLDFMDFASPHLSEGGHLNVPNFQDAFYLELGKDLLALTKVTLGEDRREKPMFVFQNISPGVDRTEAAITVVNDEKPAGKIVAENGKEYQITAGSSFVLGTATPEGQQLQLSPGVDPEHMQAYFDIYGTLVLFDLLSANGSRAYWDPRKCRSLSVHSRSFASDPYSYPNLQVEKGAWRRRIEPGLFGQYNY